MDALSRLVFMVASGILMMLASALILYSVFQVFEGFGTPGHAITAKLLDAVG